jgi:hypothetical protein
MENQAMTSPYLLIVCGYVKNEKQLYDANGPKENLKRAFLIFLSADTND